MSESGQRHQPHGIDHPRSGRADESTEFSDLPFVQSLLSTGVEMDFRVKTKGLPRNEKSVSK
jgi:hypothetical protein